MYIHEIAKLRREIVDIRNELYELQLGEYAEDHPTETQLLAAAEEELDGAQRAMLGATVLLELARLEETKAVREVGE